jgi:ApaG protein
VDTAITRGIRVAVRSQYVAEQSDVRAGKFVFSYTIRISNETNVQVQLRSRRWHIQHASGKVEEVSGPGVVGKQPKIPPGHSFEYTSGCVLTTPHGTMQGSYEMVLDDGSAFDAAIPAFSLAVPHTLN